MPTVQTELKVTDDQKSKIEELSSTMRDKMRDARNAGGGQDFQSMSQEERQKAMGEMRKKMQGVNKELDEQAVKILDADQLAREAVAAPARRRGRADSRGSGQKAGVKGRSDREDQEAAGKPYFATSAVRSQRGHAAQMQKMREK